MNKYDVTKLPKWAQKRLERQEHAIAILEEYIQSLKDERAKAEAGTSEICYFISPDIATKYYLPRDAKFTFTLPDGSEVGVAIIDEGLSVSVDGRMSVYPRNANSIWIGKIMDYPGEA